MTMVSPHTPRFGAIIDNPSFHNVRRYPAPLSPQEQGWDVRTVSQTPATEANPLGWVKQALGSAIDVRFFKGKRGDNAVVTTPRLTYIALPGSKLVFPDTRLELPGTLLEGKVSTVLDPGAPAQPQTVTKQAMVLCGGLSTRFEPVSGETTGLPKPSVPLVENESIARNIIEHLKQHGFERILIHTYYLREQVKRDLEGIEGVELVYLDDPEPSGSAGGIYKSLKQGKVNLEEPILVLAGDAVTNGDISGLLNAHARNQSAVTIGVQQVADEDVNQFGIIQTDDPSGIASGEIMSFLEKPSLEVAGPNRLGSTGIYVFSPSVYPHLEAMGDDILGGPREPGNQPIFDYGMNFLPTWLSRKTETPALSSGTHMWAEVLKGYWNDVGNPIDYLRTLGDMAQGRLGEALASRINQHNYRNGVMFWPNTQNKAEEDGAVLEGNIIVADKPNA